VQEAITNTLKHSRADNLTIETSIVNNANDQQIARICIYDDGCGTLPPRSSGRGLLNMQKRADLIGAKLRIDSQPGHGLRVTLEIPVPETQTTGKR
jgi:signal transduction histidine kinase